MKVPDDASPGAHVFNEALNCRVRGALYSDSLHIEPRSLIPFRRTCSDWLLEAAIRSGEGRVVKLTMVRPSD
jgi:hypothetical protein